MELWIVLVASVLVFLSFNMLMQRSFSRILLGLLVLSNAANLFIFVSPGLVKGLPAFIQDESLAGIPHADPLPQALILTAIVIGMGVLAFSLGLAMKMIKILGVSDVDELRGE